MPNLFAFAFRGTSWRGVQMELSISVSQQEYILLRYIITHVLFSFIRPLNGFCLLVSDKISMWYKMKKILSSFGACFIKIFMLNRVLNLKKSKKFKNKFIKIWHILKKFWKVKNSNFFQHSFQIFYILCSIHMCECTHNNKVLALKQSCYLL